MRRSGIRRARSSSSSSTTVTLNDNSTPQSTEIPNTIPLTNPTTWAAVKIQSAYRSHLIRTLVKRISAVNSESNRLERLIQRQDTVDAIRASDRERIRMNEALMELLLTLDSVPGVDPTVRELRRSVSRKIVGLQEILDAVCVSSVGNWDGFLREWDEVMEGMEEEMCVERGGYEMEKFCAENLGFRCFQRFLRD